MEKERLMNQNKNPDEETLEMSIRPYSLEEYIGQSKVTKNLKVFIEAALQRNEVVDHMLFYGPPGLGKTTLAMIIANEMGTNLRTISGPAIEKTGDLAAILSSLGVGDILFIDEIHRIPRQVEEILYSAMEDFYIDIIIGSNDEMKRSVRLDLPPFTLVGATTKAGMISAPLRDRFGIIEHLEYYSPKELKQIVLRSAKVFGVTIEESGAFEIAKRSRGTPRIANRLLKRVRDFAQIQGDGVITDKIADKALNALQVDTEGLDTLDRKILKVLIDGFNGGPVGLDTLCSAIGEEKETIEMMYEPFLLQNGFIQRTPRGRMATEKAYRHLNRKTHEKHAS